MVDTTPPVLTYCPDDIEELITSGALFTTIVWDRPTATDDSGAVNLTFSTFSSESLFVRVDGVPFEVVYIFSDQAGNTVTCSFSVSAICKIHLNSFKNTNLYFIQTYLVISHIFSVCLCHLHAAHRTVIK